MAQRFQQLGSFSAVLENLQPAYLQKFSQVGGKWVVVLLKQLSRADSDSVIYNQNHFMDKKLVANSLGIAFGSWFNGWGGDVQEDADTVEYYVRRFNARPVVLDLESPYQNGKWRDPATGELKDGRPDLMPALLKEVRKRLPTTSIMVSTNGMNSSMIYNGRTLNPAQSCVDLTVRVAPQWYSSYADGTAFPGATGSPWANPAYNMDWLKKNGSTDFNFQDVTAPASRGLPLSYVHGTLEVTGLENSSLQTSINQLKQAKASGYTVGFSTYLLENTPDSDWAVLQSVRNTLYYE